MRHVRMLGLCLVAVFAMSATTLVVASPAFANCNSECKQHKLEEKIKKIQEKIKKIEAKEAIRCAKVPACVKAKEEEERQKQELERLKQVEKEKLLEEARAKSEFTKMKNCPAADPSSPVALRGIVWGLVLPGG